jgi:Paraquat-inducible protein A
MTPTSSRLVAIAVLVVSLALLIPGLFARVLTIRGVLTRDGIAHVAPMMLERGLSNDTIRTLKSMMNPGMIALIEATGGDLRKMIIERLTPQLISSLQKSAADVTVYDQSRSIVGSVRRLYEVGSPVPATLILLFSVVVPLGKAALVTWAMFLTDVRRRQRVLHFVESIAKWSMADVFVVALFIAYLAAQASQTATRDQAAAPPLIAFTAQVGAGFYWFAAYCLFSLASQQFLARWARRSSEGVEGTT